jgi:hypothetical protein
VGTVSGRGEGGDDEREGGGDGDDEREGGARGAGAVRK